MSNEIVLIEKEEKHLTRIQDSKHQRKEQNL